MGGCEGAFKEVDERKKRVERPFIIFSPWILVVTTEGAMRYDT